jgi:hypothetical protein
MKTIEQAATELNITVTMLKNEHRKGNLPMVVIGKNKYVREDDLNKWFESKLVKKPAKRPMSAEHRAKLVAAGAARKTKNA